MSNSHLAAVRGMDVKGPARAVLMVLADRANEAGECWPSIATLSAESGFSRTAVKDSLRLLRDVKGLVSWNRRRDSSGDLTSSRYLLTLRGRAGDAPPRAGDAPQVGRETPQGRAGADHKASVKATERSINEASLLGDEIFPPDELAPSKKNLQELAESIYREYPRKTAKEEAVKAILKAMRTNDPGFLIERTKAYCAAIAWKEKQFIPYPSSWFNKGHFNDDPSEWKQPSVPTSKPQTATVNTGRRQSSNQTTIKP